MNNRRLASLYATGFPSSGPVQPRSWATTSRVPRKGHSTSLRINISNFREGRVLHVFWLRLHTILSHRSSFLQQGHLQRHVWGHHLSTPHAPTSGGIMPTLCRRFRGTFTFFYGQPGHRRPIRHRSLFQGPPSYRHEAIWHGQEGRSICP